MNIPIQFIDKNLIIHTPTKKEAEQIEKLFNQEQGKKWSDYWLTYEIETAYKIEENKINSYCNLNYFKQNKNDDYQNFQFITAKQILSSDNNYSFSLLEPLNLIQFNIIKPNSIFSTGFGFIEHPWSNDAKTNLASDGKSVLVKWVATKGNIDWAIYHSLDANFEPNKYLDGYQHLKATDEQIYKNGAKLHNEEKIKEFIPCDEKTFKMYRH